MRFVPFVFTACVLQAFGRDLYDFSIKYLNNLFDADGGHCAGSFLAIFEMFTRYSVESPSSDEDWMKLAYNAALDAFAAGEVPVGAVIIRKNQSLAVTHNDVIGSGSVLGHCELEAIRQAAVAIGDWRLNECTLYVTKEPCPMCSGACVMSRIGRVVFAIGDNKMGCLGGCGCNFASQISFNHSFTYTTGILEQPCRKLLQKFFYMRRTNSIIGA
ncbi:MAG: nucleoside deaminase [Puniceicoccales bacterium]|jgi:tRNA(adenine34) deaminase|nr:nucleoside deaminase [Puniceicoccales bacterium]